VRSSEALPLIYQIIRCHPRKHSMNLLKHVHVKSRTTGSSWYTQQIPNLTQKRQVHDRVSMNRYRHIRSQFKHWHPVSSRPVLILPFHVMASYSEWTLPVSCFSQCYIYMRFSVSHAHHMGSPFHAPWFDHLNDIYYRTVPKANSPSDYTHGYLVLLQADGETYTNV
jgi:hypothetical protein